MQLRIETFSNSRGGNAFFKAVTHPLAARAMGELTRRLDRGQVAIYAPDGCLDGLSDLYDLSRLDVEGCSVQDVTAIGRPVLGRPAQPVTEVGESGARLVFVVAFDAARIVDHIRHLLPPGAEVVSLDAIRLPDALLSNMRRYLDPLNFATNFVFFRDQDGLHTRLVTANYWAGYGARELALWLLLYDEAGKELAEWREAVPPGSASIVLDSRAIRARLGLPAFTGQLFMHVVGAVGHDVVKYALDTFGDSADACLSCTHDANSWPADFYAGLPPPATGRSRALPRRMGRTQGELPTELILYDGTGRETARRRFGRLLRRDSVAVDIDDVIDGAALPSGYGHFELVYDFTAGDGADGWLHGLFRYEHRASGHTAETSFGAHVFNTALTYKGEPQSYAGRPPGLSTRLFLRLGEQPHDTLCHLIYAASTPWHAKSTTDLVLHDAGGTEVARERVAIPCSGSRFSRYHEAFDRATRDRAGANPYIIVRDATCRLFGYHGLLAEGGAFSLDHMFGF